MKIFWHLSAALSLLCGVLSGWLLFTSGAGAGMLAAGQLFIVGALAAVACAGVSASLAEARKRIIGVALVACYVLALMSFLISMGNVR